MGRKIRGQERKEVVSVRIEPWKQRLLWQKYKSVQHFFDEKLKDEFSGPHEAIIVKKETVTVDDF